MLKAAQPGAPTSSVASGSQGDGAPGGAQSQRRTVPSAAPDASSAGPPAAAAPGGAKWPAGAQHTQLTTPVWPSSVPSTHASCAAGGRAG